MFLSRTNHLRYPGSMPKISVSLPYALASARKALGAPLRELMRLGLHARNASMRDPSASSDDGIPPEDGPESAVSGDWMTVQDAATALGITESRVHHLSAEGWLDSRKDGWRRLVSAESVAADLARRTPPYPESALAYRSDQRHDSGSPAR
jgi:hypothetical protein